MTGSGLSQIQTSDQTKLTRGLKRRHIELIAIGGAIGVGLFLGSAKAVQNAGPGLILGYAVGGLVIFFIMRALGELLLYRPVAGSFVTYADEFVGPFAGFVTGWSYWFTWVVTGMAELTAIGVYVSFSNRPSGSSTFRLSTSAVSMSLTGSRFSSDSAPGPFHHGSRRRGGTI
jgi:amino acid transporter, AAT family